MGDVIWSLPLIEYMGGAEVLYLVEDLPGVNMTKADIDFLIPLLLKQPYINRVEIWTDQPFDIDLDAFRNKHHKSHFGNMVSSFFDAYDIEMPNEYHTKPWLTIDNNPTNLTVISRTIKVWSRPAFNPYFQDLLQSGKADNAIFVGLPFECDFFNETYKCNIPYHPVKDGLELANVIGNCKLWFGNQAMPSVVAEATKVRTILEARRDIGHKDHFFERDTLTYV